MADQLPGNDGSTGDERPPAPLRRHYRILRRHRPYCRPRLRHTPIHTEVVAVFDAFANAPPELLLAALLRDAATRAYILQRPLLVDLLVRSACRRSGLDCSQVEEALPAMLGVGQPGETSSTLDRRQAGHLMRCPECYELYALASAVAIAQATSILPTWPA